MHGGFLYDDFVRAELLKAEAVKVKFVGDVMTQAALV